MMVSRAVQNWFSTRRFGLFLHFGLYSLEGWHEQDQMRRRISRSDYCRLTERFNPTQWDPDAILDIAEDAGMEYVCLTAKHHDGFCLWNTAATEFNVMNTPYGTDLLREFADACHQRKFPLGIYYSVVDWHHPNYPNQGRHHEIPVQQQDNPDWEKYMLFLKAQITELCTNYGEVRHWFWDMNVPEYHDPSVNHLLRSLQPRIVINNRGFDEGDFGTPEREYADNSNDQMTASGYHRPTEACNSVGAQSWGYREDEFYYSPRFLIDSIDAMMSKGANYLLNVGPDGTGRIPDQPVALLREVGLWYKNVQESFADTSPASGLAASDSIRLTKRGNSFYVHIKSPVQSDGLALPPFDVLPDRCYLLNTGEDLRCSTALLPSRWREGKRILWVKGLPADLLAGNETPVIRMDFDTEVPFTCGDDVEFEG